MTQINVDHQQARKILTEAIKVARAETYEPQHDKAIAIGEVMLGQHLTYRYILLTNLLAKATNKAANPLALQAKADLHGAFDSRSLCHKVVVDFDRDADQLAGKLGRSNEPYLNKPARYPALTTDNAVRRGYDRRILELCIDILGGLNDEVDAKSALEDAIYFVMQRDALVTKAVELTGDATLHRVLVDFLQAALLQSCEGESCAIITGTAFYILGRGYERSFDIKIHPVNQAGSSSNEILDIDIYLSETLIYAAEVKDKIFNANDVDHAASKVATAGLQSLFFICGPRSQRASEALDYVAKIAIDKKVRVSFVDVEQFFLTSLGFAPVDLDAEEIWKFIDTCMITSRVKDSTKTYVISCAKAVGLIQ